MVMQTVWSKCPLNQHLWLLLLAFLFQKHLLRLIRRQTHIFEPKEINLDLGVNADLVTNGDIFLVDLPLVDGVETFEGRF